MMRWILVIGLLSGFIQANEQKVYHYETPQSDKEIYRFITFQQPWFHISKLIWPSYQSGQSSQKFVYDYLRAFYPNMSGKTFEPILTQKVSKVDTWIYNMHPRRAFITGPSLFIQFQRYKGKNLYYIENDKVPNGAGIFSLSDEQSQFLNEVVCLLMSNASHRSTRLRKRRQMAWAELNWFDPVTQQFQSYEGRFFESNEQLIKAKEYDQHAAMGSLHGILRYWILKELDFKSYEYEELDLERINLYLSQPNKLFLKPLHHVIIQRTLNPKYQAIFKQILLRAPVSPTKDTKSQKNKITMIERSREALADAELLYDKVDDLLLAAENSLEDQIEHEREVDSLWYERYGESLILLKKFQAIKSCTNFQQLEKMIRKDKHYEKIYLHRMVQLSPENTVTFAEGYIKQLSDKYEQKKILEVFSETDLSLFNKFLKHYPQWKALWTDQERHEKQPISNDLVEGYRKYIQSYREMFR